MPLRDTQRSRIVAWLKILLPLAALALLSTLFLLSRTVDPTQSIPLSRSDLEDRARDQQITAPSFAGATREGHLVSFTADTAKLDSDNSGRVIADRLSAQIDLTGGAQITFASRHGTVDDEAGLAMLDGDVVVTSSTGYRVETDTLTSRMRDIAAETAGTVTAEGPPGRFSAGKMALSSDDQTGDVHLLFTNGVKLIYDPRN